VPRTIAEADWKVLRRIHPLALERYCERTLAEIERVTHNSSKSTHQRYPWLAAQGPLSYCMQST
jgi:hypothetical protein